MSKQCDGAGDGAAIVHPEEIRLESRIRIGEWVVVRSQVRITPAGLVCTGQMVAAILLSTAAVVRAVRLPKSR